MQISLDSGEGLARKLTIIIPPETIEQECKQRLTELAKNARVDGFRPGKVPLSLIKQRYGSGVHQEAVQKLVQSSLHDAIEKESLKPAAMPNIERLDSEQGQSVEFVASFDVYPEFDLVDFTGIKITQKTAQIEDSDIDEALERLRKLHAKWENTDNAAVATDKVLVDLVGHVAGEAVESETVSEEEILLDEERFLPEIRQALIGKKAGEESKVIIDIPENAPRKNVAGKQVEYVMQIKSVKSPQLPELNEEFSQLFGIVDGGLEALRKDVLNNLERDLEQRLTVENNQVVFDKMRDLNAVELPQSLIEQELAGLKTQYTQAHGEEHEQLDIPEDELERLNEQAKKQVHLRVLLQKRIEEKELKPEESRMQQKLMQMAQAYSDPQQLMSLYQDNQQMATHLEGLALEEQVVEDLLADAEIDAEPFSYKAFQKIEQE